MQALTAQSGTIVFTVKDNTTGYRLKSSNLVLQNNKSTPFSTDRKGQAYLTLEVGWYKFEFTSSGYKNHRTYFLVEEDKKLNVNIIMDSIEHSNPTVDESSNFILEGYIIDSLTGNPLNDVGVALPHFTMKTKTDETGYYRLSTKINHFSEVPYNEITKIDIEFSKNGLIVHKTKDFLVLPTLIRKNIELNLNGIETIESYAHGFNRTTEYSDINQEGTVILSNDIIEFLTPVSCNYNSTIRVGTSCSCTTCSTVQSMSIESYVQTGLDNEWISSWASNSLKAGAVAYRSYGAYYTVNPVNANFNIASSTCNQVWGSETAQTCINAATATSGEALEKNSTLFRSEYSAENYNAPQKLDSCLR